MTSELKELVAEEQEALEVRDKALGGILQVSSGVMQMDRSQQQTM